MRTYSRKLYAIVQGDKQAFVGGKDKLVWLTILGPSGEPRLNLNARLCRIFESQLEPGTYEVREGVETWRPGPKLV